MTSINFTAEPYEDDRAKWDMINSRNNKLSERNATVYDKYNECICYLIKTPPTKAILYFALYISRYCNKANCKAFRLEQANSPRTVNITSKFVGTFAQYAAKSLLKLQQHTAARPGDTLAEDSLRQLGLLAEGYLAAAVDFSSTTERGLTYKTEGGKAYRMTEKTIKALTVDGVFDKESTLLVNPVISMIAKEIKYYAKCEKEAANSHTTD